MAGQVGSIATSGVNLGLGAVQQTLGTVGKAKNVALGVTDKAVGTAGVIANASLNATGRIVSSGTDATANVNRTKNNIGKNRNNTRKNNAGKNGNNARKNGNNVRKNKTGTINPLLNNPTVSVNQKTMNSPATEGDLESHL